MLTTIDGFKIMMTQVERKHWYFYIHFNLFSLKGLNKADNSTKQEENVEVYKRRNNVSSHILVVPKVPINVLAASMMKDEEIPENVYDDLLSGFSKGRTSRRQWRKWHTNYPGIVVRNSDTNDSANSY